MIYIALIAGDIIATILLILFFQITRIKKTY